MPCNSDHMEPTGKERYLQQTAALYAYAQKTFGNSVPLVVRAAAVDIYCRADFTEALCEFLRGIKGSQPDEFDRIVYNARDAQSRALADWWEEHEKADRAKRSLSPTSRRGGEKGK